jgi:hypothetical protein
MHTCTHMHALSPAITRACTHTLSLSSIHALCAYKTDCSVCASNWLFKIRCHKLPEADAATLPASKRCHSQCTLACIEENMHTAACKAHARITPRAGVTDTCTHLHASGTGSTSTSFLQLPGKPSLPKAMFDERQQSRVVTRSAIKE